MRKTKTIVAMIIVSTLTFQIGFSNAKEPVRPTVDYTFDAKKEAKIQELKDLPLEQAFENLQDIDFFLDQDFLNKAIFTAFEHRKADAIDYSIDLLKFPRTEIIGGEMVSRSDFDVARQTLRVFPQKARVSLVELYSTADPVARCNIIVVLGKMAGGKSIRNLLIEALDDKTICQEAPPEILEEPFRVCDEAYNQWILRYKIYKMKNDALRFISDGHSIDTRDHCIDLLRDRF